MEDDKDRYGRPVKKSTWLWRLTYGVKGQGRFEEIQRTKEIEATDRQDAEQQANNFMKLNLRRFFIALVKSKYVWIGFILGLWYFGVLGWVYNKATQDEKYTTGQDTEIRG